MTCQVCQGCRQALKGRGLEQNSTQSIQKETTCQQIDLALLASTTVREDRILAFWSPVVEMFLRQPHETNIVTRPRSQDTSIRAEWRGAGASEADVKGCPSSPIS